MTGAADWPDGRPPATAPCGEPALDDNERRWLEGYVERLKTTPGALVERVVVYGSKARGDAGPESDIDVLVLVRDGPGAVETAGNLVYRDVDNSYGVNHSVVVRTTAQWNEGLEMELPFPRNVEAEGIEVHPARRPARRTAGRPATGDPDGDAARRADMDEGSPAERRRTRRRDRDAEGRTAVRRRHSHEAGVRRRLLRRDGVVPDAGRERRAAEGPPRHRRAPPDRARTARRQVERPDPEALDCLGHGVQLVPGQGQGLVDERHRRRGRKPRERSTRWRETRSPSEASRSNRRTRRRKRQGDHRHGTEHKSSVDAGGVGVSAARRDQQVGVGLPDRHGRWFSSGPADRSEGLPARFAAGRGQVGNAHQARHGIETRG